MKFLCLGYLNVEDFDRETEEVKSEILNRCFAQCKPFRATGKVIAEAGLEATTGARSIRPRDGVATVTEGPFLDGVAQLGSFFIVEADDLDDAVRVASLHPAAIFGEQYGFGIEVRPLQHQDIFS